MNTISTVLLDELFEARRRVETYCQAVVDSGSANWWVNENGDTELHLQSGETFLFGDQGVTRLN